MDRKVKSFRLRVDLLDWMEGYAKSRGSTQVAVLERAVASFMAGVEGGVPDLPVAIVPPPPRKPDVDEVRRAEQEGRAAIWARQQKLNEAKLRASGWRP